MPSISSIFFFKYFSSNLYAKKIDKCGKTKGLPAKMSEILKCFSINFLCPRLFQEEMYFSIDNEPYEVRPVKITLLPKSINVFCS